MKKMLAKITSATLEIKERGILNFWIFVDYEESGCQGIGGICLDEFDKEKEKRVGTAFGCEMIRRLLLTLEVNDFSEMKGKIIWVHGDGEAFDFKPKGIETLNINKGDRSKSSEPFIFDELAKEFNIK